MKQQIDDALSQLDKIKVKTKEELEQFRIDFLGSKGKIKHLFNEFKTLSKEEKRDYGKILNSLKQDTQKKYQELKKGFEDNQFNDRHSIDFDFTKPVGDNQLGSCHPISVVRKEIIDIFSRIGFAVEEALK